MSQLVPSVDIYGKVRDVNLSDLKWRPSAYAIVIKDDMILLCPQFGDKHDLPGGGIDIGEMPDAAAIRETKEETGIDVANPRLLHLESNFFTFNHAQETDSFQSILIYYSCDYVGGELSTDGFDEFEKEYAEMAEWVPIKELEGVKPSSSNDWRPLVWKLYEDSRN